MSRLIFRIRIVQNLPEYSKNHLKSFHVPAEILFFGPRFYREGLNKFDSTTRAKKNQAYKERHIRFSKGGVFFFYF